MAKVISYLDCGCAILENGSRHWCPSCNSPHSKLPVNDTSVYNWSQEFDALADTVEDLKKRVKRLEELYES